MNEDALLRRAKKPPLEMRRTLPENITHQLKNIVFEIEENRYSKEELRKTRESLVSLIEDYFIPTYGHSNNEMAKSNLALDLIKDQPEWTAENIRGLANEVISLLGGRLIDKPWQPEGTKRLADYMNPIGGKIGEDIGKKIIGGNIIKK